MEDNIDFSINVIFLIMYKLRWKYCSSVRMESRGFWNRVVDVSSFYTGSVVYLNLCFCFLGKTLPIYPFHPPFGIEGQIFFQLVNHLKLMPNTLAADLSTGKERPKFSQRSYVAERERQAVED